MAKAVRQRFPYTDSLWFSPKTERAWHDLRRTDITATDSAALFGVSPYATAFELYHRKAGNLHVTFEENERMRWGKRLQNAIAIGICEDNGWRIINGDPFLYVRSKDTVGMGASPDYIVFCHKRGVGTLEIKNVDRFIAKSDWQDDEAPPHIEFQLQHQLECARLPWGAVGGLIGGNEARVIIRERDAEVGIEIANRVTDMWRRVSDDDPPGPNYLKDFDAIKQLYLNATPGAVMDASDPANEEVARRIAELCAAERDAYLRGKEAEEDGKRAKAELLTLIGDNEAVTNLSGFRVSTTTTHVEASVQERKAYSFRSLRISPIKAKEGK